MFNYDTFTLRNRGYISAEIQQKLKESSVLVAGCGVGSYIAEAATRLGVGSITLLDGDTIESHNLNRQAFTQEDVGGSKVERLAWRLKQINPELHVRAVNEYLDTNNAKQHVKDHSFVFDTIDFLDLSAIVALHDTAEDLKIPIASSISAGWGASCLFFPNDRPTLNFRKIFGLPESGQDLPGYTEAFVGFLEKIAPSLPDEVVQAMQTAVKGMADGRPCPAPHVSVGSFSVAALACNVFVRYLRGQSIRTSPDMILYDLGDICQTHAISLA